MLSDLRLFEGKQKGRVRGGGGEGEGCMGKRLARTSRKVSCVPTLISSKYFLRIHIKLSATAITRGRTVHASLPWYSPRTIRIIHIKFSNFKAQSLRGVLHRWSVFAIALGPALIHAVRAPLTAVGRETRSLRTAIFAQGIRFLSFCLYPSFPTG